MDHGQNILEAQCAERQFAENLDPTLGQANLTTFHDICLESAHIYMKKSSKISYYIDNRYHCHRLEFHVIFFLVVHFFSPTMPIGGHGILQARILE